MHRLLDIIEKDNKRKRFLISAEELFRQNRDFYEKTLLKQFPLIDFSRFLPSAEERYYYIDFVVNYIDSIDLNVLEELKAAKQSILLLKRTLKKNINAGVYEEKASLLHTDWEKVNKWIADNDQLFLSDFAFYDELRISTKVKYSIQEIYYLVLDTMKNNPSSDGNPSFMKYPLAQIDRPWFNLSSGRQELKYDFNKETEVYDIFYENTTDSGAARIKIGDLPQISDEESLSTYYAKKAFNQWDFNVYVVLTNHVTPTVIRDKYLILSLESLIKELKYIPEGSSPEQIYRLRYDFKKALILSLDKFRDYSVQYVEEYQSGKKVGEGGGKKSESFLLSSYTLDMDEYVGMLRVDFVNSFLDVWLKAQMQLIQAEEWKALSSTAQPYSFFFQKQRISSYDTDYRARLYVNAVHQRFPGKRKDFFIKEFLGVLAEYKSLRIFVKDYEFNKPGDYFTISFITLSDQEQEVFGIKNKPV